MIKKIHFLSLTLSCVFTSLLFASEPIKIAVISDTHYLASALAQPGEALHTYRTATGRNVAHLHPILDSVFHQIVRQKADVLFVSGDITNHGERASHLEFTQKLHALKNKGMKIFVVPGNHDINVPDAKAYVGKKVLHTPSISDEDFAALYAPFGFQAALRRDTSSLSYLAPLTDSLWLLAIDTNRYGEHTTTSISGGRILPETLSWCCDILRTAREKNVTVVAMMHHGLVEHIPYQATFFPDYIVRDWEHNAQVLADNGLQVIFTGHFHANDVTRFVSDSGNILYDIETGSLAEYPFPYRMVSIRGKTLNITTHVIKQIEHVQDLQETYRKKLEEHARKVIRYKLRNIPIPIPDTMFDTLADILSDIAVLHAAGDEEMDDKLRSKIRQFAFLLQQDDEQICFDDFQLDLPPADNHLTLILK